MSRLLIGAGTGGIQVSAFAIVTSFITDKSKINEYVGYIESSVGVGLVIGPSLGTILYDVGGFTANYWFVIFAFLVEFCLNFIFLRAHEHVHVEQLSKTDLKEPLIHSNEKEKKVSYLGILKEKYSFFALSSLAFAIIQWSFFDPVLTARFYTLGLSEETAGLAFLGLSICYAVSCSINSKFEHMFGNKTCLQIGILCLGLSSFVIGSNLFLNPSSVWPVFLGLAMTGFF